MTMLEKLAAVICALTDANYCVKEKTLKEAIDNLYDEFIQDS